MSVQPDTDKRLSRTSGGFLRNGSRLLTVGAVLYVIGAVLLLTGASTVAGLMCVGLATPPTIAAIALLLSGGAGKRFANHRDWA
jgi:hypothetical protein